MNALSLYNHTPQANHILLQHQFNPKYLHIDLHCPELPARPKACCPIITNPCSYNTRYKNCEAELPILL